MIFMCFSKKANRRIFELACTINKIPEIILNENKDIKKQTVKYTNMKIFGFSNPSMFITQVDHTKDFSLSHRNVPKEARRRKFAIFADTLDC